MIDVILDTLIDSVKLLPFLFITYLIMEFIEHKTGEKAKNIIKKHTSNFFMIIGKIAEQEKKLMQLLKMVKNLNLMRLI